MPGYTGGAVPNPTYENVCTGNTGHAEATRIEYDPAQVSYHDLLTVFFATHDPTTLNRQGMTSVPNIAQRYFTRRRSRKPKRRNSSLT